MDPDISVVVPVYNTGAFLDTCLDSILGSRDAGLEVILVDDGSTDDSPGRCMRHAESDRRVRYVRQENAGVSAARNRGLAAARGRYVQFVDADDRLVPGAMDRILRAVRESGADIVRFGTDDVSESDAVEGGTRPRRHPDCRSLLESLSRGSSVERMPVFSYSVRRSILERDGIRFTPGCAYGEDHEFTHLVVFGAASVDTLDAVLYRYVQHDGNAMRKATLRHFEYIEAMLRVRDRLSDRGATRNIVDNYSGTLIPRALANVVVKSVIMGFERGEILARMRQGKMLSCYSPLSHSKPAYRAFLCVWHVFPGIAGRLIRSRYGRNGRVMPGLHGGTA